LPPPAGISGARERSPAERERAAWDRWFLFCVFCCFRTFVVSGSFARLRLNIFEKRLCENASAFVLNRWE